MMMQVTWWLMQVAKTCGYAVKDLILETEDGKVFNSIPEGKKLHEIPYFINGAVVRAKNKNPPESKMKQSRGLEVSQMQ
jgi:hypothetical protein